jgi:hypothetical protein
MNLPGDPSESDFPKPPGRSSVRTMEGSRFQPIGRAFDLAIPEAEALGHNWIGELHILLGISRTDSRARRVLDAAGVTHERIQEAASELLKGSATDPEGSELARWMFNPAGAKAINWAEGYATGRGETPGDDHLLVAVLWDNVCFTAAVFRRLGVSRAAVLESLRREGGSAPDADPPPDPPQVDWGEKIELTMDELRVVVRELPKRINLGSRQFGWNHDGKGHGFVVADRAVDLHSHVGAILAASKRKKA